MTHRKGEELIWVFPWMRSKLKPPKAWYSVECGGGFDSLAEIDKFWDEYSEASRKAALREECAREDFYF